MVLLNGNLLLALLFTPVNHSLPSLITQQPLPVSIMHRPPGLYEGLELTPAQTEQIKKLEREFTPIIEGQIQRTKQLRMHTFDSTGVSTLQAGQERLLRDIRNTVLTQSQRIIFDRNRAARKEYSDRKRAARSVPMIGAK